MREMTLRFSEKLSTVNTFWVHPVGEVFHVVCRVRVSTNLPERVFSFMACEYGRDVPHDRKLPALTRLSESQWRVEPSLWPSGSGIPDGVALSLVGYGG